MKKTSKTIVFFGSGPVAAKSLELLQANFEVEAVITKPSTKREMENIVGEVPVISVSNKSELDEVTRTKNFTSDVGILIDFGIIVSQEVIDSFSFGILNSHFSLLPEWRGADPISFAILSGQERSGVSLMILTAGMDEGPILSIAEETIEYNETTSTLTQKLILLSDSLLQDAVPKYLTGEITGVSQEKAAELLGLPSTPTYSRKLTKEDGRIDWSKPATTIEREIRAYDNWPKSYTSLNSIDIIIKNAAVIQESGVAGSYHFDKKSLIVHCGEDALSIQSIQPTGKKEMPIQAFLAGYANQL